MNDSPERDVEVFTGALRVPAGERAAYLEKMCGSDTTFRERVEALLEAHGHAGSFLEDTARKSSTQDPSPPPVGEKPGDYIGHFKLLQQIGEGGCGIVFLAEQGHPVRRRVALKIIKPGMDTKSVIARFEAERQALALMDHPSIAKIFDAGATESGRPYFVMELVRGIKITEYCDQHSLTTEERLKLFIQVCQAVQHAHQKGVIHRDIKPSNILVTTTEEDAALPVVIDFGIAKATTNQRLTDKTIFTAFEMLLGTPAYMSPEQAELAGADVDTRSDIYSLGVLLYELLAGSTPFDTGDLLKKGLDEIRRVIREQEPVRPSTKLSKMTGADLTPLALRRKVEAPTLIRSICGDLDWIAMKALEKDRTRRYETANGLALDVQRYLDKEPVFARPPSKLYKLQKAVLRNKLLFVGIGVVALVLIVSLVIVSNSLAKERRSRREAEAAEVRSEAASVKSQQVTKFLEDMLQSVGPAAARGQDTTLMREILDRTSERIGTEMTNQPSVEAELRNLIGTLYYRIGNYRKAEEMHRAALGLSQKIFGSQSVEMAASLNNLGLDLLSEGKLSEAEKAAAEALAIRRHLYGNESPETATSLNNLSSVCRQFGRPKEAEALAREGLQIRLKLFGKEHLDVADSLRNLGIILGDEGQWQESEAMLREVLAMRRKLLGTDHPWVASALNDVAWAADAQGKLDEAESLQREALIMRRRLLPEGHPDVATSLHLVGDTMRKRGNLNEAYSILNAALSIQRKVLGDDDPASLDTLHSLGLTLAAEQKLGEAETVYREEVTLRRKRMGNSASQTLYALRDLGLTLEAETHWAEAEKVHREELALWRQKPETDDAQILYALNRLRLTLDAESKWAEEETVRRETLAIWRKRAGSNDPQTLYALRDVAETLERERKFADAETAHREALAAWRKRLGNDDPQTLYTLNQLGLTLEAEGKLTEAEQAHREALASWHKRGEKETPPPWFELESLTRILSAQKKFADAEQLLNETLTPAMARQPSNINLLTVRLDLRGRLGHWQEAAGDATLAFENQPSNPRYAEMAALLVKSHNRPDYEHFCNEILKMFASTGNAYIADQVAKSCLFEASQKFDLKLVDHLIDIALTNGANDANALPFYQDCKALCEYRLGHYSQAIEWAQKPLKIPGIYVHGHTCATLAMALWRLGEKDKARAMLANGNALAPAEMPDHIANDPSNAWLAWLFARIQLDEADALIHPESTRGHKFDRP